MSDRLSCAGAFIVILIFVPALASASVILDDPNTTSLSRGLVGYWPLDGNTTGWLTDTTQDVRAATATPATLPQDVHHHTSPTVGKIR